MDDTSDVGLSRFQTAERFTFVETLYTFCGVGTVQWPNSVGISSGRVVPTCGGNDQQTLRAGM